MSNATDVCRVTSAILDDWAMKPGGPVALCLKQRLEPVEERGIIFPPTYAGIGYNIDKLSDGTRVATIDSVGSQANRLEPIFKSESQDPKDWLVPQIEVVIREEACGECDGCKRNADDPKKASRECEQPREVTRSLLDLAHRAADAVVRSSPDLLKLIGPAFKKLQQGDAGPLCAIAPTSLVFGVWDSRGDTGVKRPRLVRSIIRAWDVEPLNAAAQFNSVWKLLDSGQREELEAEAEKKKKNRSAAKTDLSEKGFADVPVRVLGGVLVKDRVEREVTVNLVALRGLRGESDSDTDAVRRYLLGLSLVAATADIELFLREGCLLRYAENGDAWYQVPRRGAREPVHLSRDVITRYAETAAGHFRTEWPKVFGDKWPKEAGKVPELKYQFDLKAAKELLAEETSHEESVPE